MAQQLHQPCQINFRKLLVQACGLWSNMVAHHIGYYILYSSMYTIPSSGFWKEIQNASKAMKFYREWPLCGFSDWSLCPQAICCCNSFLYPILLVLSLIWLRILFLSQYLIFGVLCFNIPPVTLRLFLKVFKVFPLSSRLRV